MEYDFAFEADAALILVLPFAFLSHLVTHREILLSYSFVHCNSYQFLLHLSFY
jgi:hypothetical protein